MLNSIMNNTNNNTNIANHLNKENLEKNVEFNPEVKNEIENKTSAGIEKKDVNQINDCQTCSERKYQDESDDGGVSFQSATKMTPTQAGTAVSSHEREHVRREQTKADNDENVEVVKNQVSLQKSICPECGKIYVSGGETTTITKETSELSQKALNKNDVQGINFDFRA